jgi:Flp pilus assembly protein TadG
MGWWAAIRDGVGRFLADDRGAAGLEFLFTSPLLFGVMVFTAEYGQALRYRIALDGAVQDTARFLARAPAEAVEDASGDPTIDIYPAFLAEADEMLDARLGRDVAMQVAVTTVDTETFRTDFHVVEVTGSVAVELPMLAFINVWLSDDVPESLTLTASQQARWGAGNPPGLVSCARLERMLGLGETCGGGV